MSEWRSSDTKAGRVWAGLTAWALAVGCIIGWGSFVMPGSTFLPSAGPVGATLGVVAAAIIIGVIYFNYSSLHKTCPDDTSSYGLTKRIVDLMGGSIDVYTAPGEGTEFVVQVQPEVCEVAVAADEEVESDELDEGVSFAGRRLLLVDDIEINREIACSMLELYGFEVEMAVDGKEAVDAVRASKPGHFDAVLMDVQMPVMNGYEATQAIRSLEDEALASVPIIALTANAFEEDRKAALDAGMNAHVAKPIVVQELIAVLSVVIAA